MPRSTSSVGSSRSSASTPHDSEAEEPPAAGSADTVPVTVESSPKRPEFVGALAIVEADDDLPLVLVLSGIALGPLPLEGLLDGCWWEWRLAGRVGDEASESLGPSPSVGSGSTCTSRTPPIVWTAARSIGKDLLPGGAEADDDVADVAVADGAGGGSVPFDWPVGSCDSPGDSPVLWVGSELPGDSEAGSDAAFVGISPDTASASFIAEVDAAGSMSRDPGM